MTEIRRKGAKIKAIKNPKIITGRRLVFVLRDSSIDIRTGGANLRHANRAWNTGLINLKSPILKTDCLMVTLLVCALRTFVVV